MTDIDPNDHLNAAPAPRPRPASYGEIFDRFSLTNAEEDLIYTVARMLSEVVSMAVAAKSDEDYAQGIQDVYKASWLRTAWVRHLSATGAAPEAMAHERAQDTFDAIIKIADLIAQDRRESAAAE